VLSAGEGLDDEHRGPAVPADKGGPSAGVLSARIRGRLRCRLMQQLANGRDIALAVGVGEQTVVADAMEPFGQNCIRKQRMNSLVASVMRLCRARPSAQPTNAIERLTKSVNELIKDAHVLQVSGSRSP
jgi:hypothetical protein